MGSFGECVLTNAGRTLLADVLANEDSIVFTRLVVGDGVYADSEKERESLQEMTGLKSMQQAYGIQYGERTEPECVRLSAVISNVDAETREALFEEGFYMNEIGLMARAGSSSESVLYAIAVTAVERGDYLPAYNSANPIEIAQDILAAVTNRTVINVEYDWSSGFFGSILVFEDITVPDSAWEESATYADYLYSADISCIGVTAEYTPSVLFSLSDAKSGLFAPVSESFDGGVRIYAKEIPTGTVTLEVIKCEKGA